MKKKNIVCLILLELCSAAVFGQQSIDSYISDSSLNRFVLIANSTNSLSSPVDLDFYPNQSQRPFQLWILNQGTSSSGGSTVIVSNANSGSRTTKYVKDGNAWHFMALASALAFGDSLWASSADILDANHSTGKYTGPTLWPSDLSIYGIVGNPSTQTVNGSHLDMIHQSPYGKGIAFERDLVYWVLDGYEGNLKRYDYVQPHQPGGSDHSAGKVRVYTDFSFTKHASLPSHIVIDANKKYLYGCDPVGKRIFRVDITTGTDNGPGSEVNSEALTEYEKYTGLEIKDIITKNLTSPVGIDVYGNRLIVTDNGTDEIIIYDILDSYREMGRIKLNYSVNADPMGVKVGPDGKIYFVDRLNKEAYQIDNEKVWPLPVEEIAESTIGVKIYPNPAESKIFVQIEGNTQSNKGELNILNILGKVVDTKYIMDSNNTIDISSLNKGVYIIQVRIGEVITTKKIIKE